MSAKSGHSVLACWTGILSRDTLGVQNARTVCPDMLSPLIGLPKCPYFPAICMSFLCVRSEYPHKKDIRFVRTVCLSTMADQNMHIRFSGQKSPAILDARKGLPRVPLKVDTHNVHANRIWLPVSARAIGNAPVGSNSSGPVVIPSVSEGGTMVGERSIWGKRSLRPLLLVTGGG